MYGPNKNSIYRSFLVFFSPAMAALLGLEWSHFCAHLHFPRPCTASLKKTAPAFEEGRARALCLRRQNRIESRGIFAISSDKLWQQLFSHPPSGESTITSSTASTVGGARARPIPLLAATSEDKKRLFMFVHPSSARLPSLTASGAVQGPAEVAAQQLRPTSSFLAVVINLNLPPFRLTP